MGGKIIKVALVDHEVSFRETVERWLRPTKDCKCVGLYGDVATALPDILKKKPDVVLLNFGLPGVSSSKTLRQIKQQVPTARVLVLTGETGETAVTEFLKAGADGWLEKANQALPLEPERLLTAIREIRSGGAFISVSGKAARYVLERLCEIDPGASIGIDLTKREREVAVLLKARLSDKEIAEKLRISATTVNTHTKHIYDKEGIHDRRDVGTRRPHT